ncbi:MAG: helix-turn-helix domain-containing protein [Bacteroidetes bacterium]|nr:helix-turn-helix domain-containing protein [Bacteroidota bacterium]
MAIEVLTKEDLVEFRMLLMRDLTELLKNKPSQTKQWLKSTEVRKLLNISPGTLQTLRMNKTISYTRIGGIIYYAYQDIEKMLQSNKVESEQTLFNSK